MEQRGWENLPEFSKALYKDTYFLKNENYEGWLERICGAYANNEEHKIRLKEYLRNYYWHPSTPISSNGGTDRGLPISCYVQKVGDNRKDIFDSWNEYSWLSSEGGGVGRDWSDVRELGASISKGGHSSGVIPFMNVDEELSKAISQGGTRRGASASYLPVWHPEILEFIDLRSPMGDQSRRAPELHHGVVIDDLFMQCVIMDSVYDLRSPVSNEVVTTIDAKEIWTKLLEMRTTIGGEQIAQLYRNV